MPLVKRRGFFDTVAGLPTFLENFFQPDLEGDFGMIKKGMTVPAVNVIDEKDCFKIEVATPGLEKEDIKINLESNVLSITGEKEEEKEEKKKNYTRREYNFSSFERYFSVPDSVNTEKINASYKNGVLTITILKKEEVTQKESKEIKIS